MPKKLLSLALALFFIMTSAVFAFALEKPTDIISEAWCVMDARTGQLLIGGAADKKMEPASITKVLTCALALEVLNPDSDYTFSAEAASYDLGSTHLAFTEGETCKVRDLLYGAMVESANDCAMGLADAVSGSQLEFVRLMNQKLAELGCKNSHFANACGMPDPNHYTTARDMALITKYAMSVEGFMTYFDAWEWTIPATNKNTERHFGTHHSMIVGSENNAYYGYDYAIGGKLGWTEEAKHTAVTAADNGTMRLICVVLKSGNKYAKYKDSIKLLDYCFENFYPVEIPATVPKKEVTVTDGGEPYGKLTVHPLASVTLLMTDGMKASDVSCKTNLTDSCELSEVSDLAVVVSFSKKSDAMETEPFSLSPEYHIVKGSSVVESEGALEEKEEDEKEFRWWIFLLIPLGIILFFTVVILLIRAYNIHKYKKQRRHRHYKQLNQR